MKKIVSYLILFLFPLILRAQSDIPDQPKPPRLVNDLANFLSQDEVNSLETKLVRFNDSSSTQIAIVIVNSFNGYEKADFATRLGDKWGVGQKKLNNGVVFLIKPKTTFEKGEVFIATGYGLEHVITDAAIKMIVDREIIPYFKNGEYFTGIDKGVDALIALSKGEYKATKQMNESNAKVIAIIIVFFFFILFIVLASLSKKYSYDKNKTISSGKHIPFWVWLLLLNSGANSHRGTFNDFSSGRGSFGGFGGGGGGFSGFGGGSFGGGGAGGSW